MLHVVHTIFILKKVWTCSSFASDKHSTFELHVHSTTVYSIHTWRPLLTIFDNSVQGVESLYSVHYRTWREILPCTYQCWPTGMNVLLFSLMLVLTLLSTTPLVSHRSLKRPRMASMREYSYRHDACMHIFNLYALTSSQYIIHVL